MDKLTPAQLTISHSGLISDVELDERRLYREAHQEMEHNGGHCHAPFRHKVPIYACHGYPKRVATLKIRSSTLSSP